MAGDALGKADHSNSGSTEASNPAGGIRIGDGPAQP
jgi:hypothetical protein